MHNTAAVDNESLFRAVVVRMQRELTHLTQSWLEPWLALQASSTEAVDKVRENNDAAKKHSVTPPAAASPDDDDDTPTPELVVLRVVHHMSMLKAEAVASDSRRAPFRAVTTSVTAFEAEVSSIVPLPFLPLSLLIENAHDDLAARETVMRGLMDLCDSTYLPELHRGTESAKTREHIQLYRKLKVELKKLFFTFSVELMPWMREILSWYVAKEKKKEAAHPPQAPTQSSGNGGGKRVASTPPQPPPVKTAPHARPAAPQQSVTHFEDEQPTQQTALMGRAPSLIELPVLEDEMAAYEQHRRAEIVQIGQQLRELRDLQDYANTLVHEQDERLDQSEAQALAALDNASASRIQLTLAAKYKIAGAALTGAIVGGLVGGPLGMIAGAKSASTIGLVALAGGATGGIVGKTVASGTASRAAAVDDDYEDAREAEQKKK